MPLGAFRLNSLAKYEVPAVVWNKSTRYNNDLTIVGSNITQSTTTSKFGTASLYANSSATTSDYFETVVTASDFGSGNWTIEGFYRLGQIDPAGVYRGLPSCGTGVDANAMNINLRSFGSGNYAIEYYWQGENWNGNANGTSGTLTAGVWYHWAISRNGSVINIYGNGTRTSSRSTTKSNLFGTAGKFRIFGPSGASAMYNSYQDAVRLSNSARYTGTTLTVPTAEYTSDTNTKLIMNFNGANGSQITTDSTT